MLRIIAGNKKRKKLLAPDFDVSRPTKDRIKEAVFSIIQFDLKDAVFLDLFAGSGQMGIEALSRGAKKAFFVDENRSAIKIIEKNLRSCGFKNSDFAYVFCNSAENFLKNICIKFDIAFIDPPYKNKFEEKNLLELDKKMNPKSIIICETDSHEKLPSSFANFYFKKNYIYSKTRIIVYKNCLE
ncbi:MAG: 16S rRNA (guanine(966)-N(2))-methyltransferase RsmD [Oscillospiraceae bacterium]|jgi:16S rRNA (guanine(966)-N(2))-methyltransferase RsmD|nr:16S rRNA (guanine(966)-N(2))-methyltransferase RsmD [Oscillospiraceae bacterium]